VPVSTHETPLPGPARAYLVVVLTLLAVGCRPSTPPASAPVPAPAAPPTLPDYGRLPELADVDQDGKPFKLAELRQGLWITAFMFTTCPMECPLLSQRMSYVQKLLKQHSPALHLLSISVTPDTDTPPVLKRYGDRYHRDPARWTFLTGPYEPALASVSRAYEEAAAREHLALKPGGFQVLHGDNLVLIDGGGHIRGFYRKDDAEIARLLADADRLAGEGATAL